MAKLRFFMTFIVLIILTIVGSACGTLPAKAPYTYVPNSMRRGSLKGPLSGRVLDAGTKKPVSGALIYACWGYSRGVGVKSPTGFIHYLLETDEDGRFLIPEVGELEDGVPKEAKVGGVTVILPGKHGFGDGKGRLTSFRLTVYKKGYIAYRSDRVFSTGEPRLNFSQHNNKVLLERWSQEMSHLKHVRFIGAVERFGNKALWELQAAQAEMEGRGRKLAQKTPTKNLALLDASELFETDDLVELLKVQEEDYKENRLKAVPRTQTSDSKHFRALSKPEAYDLAYRVWKVSGNGLSRKYRRLLATYPNTKPMDQVGDRSFEARSKGILAHVFMDKKTNVLVSVTCGMALCKNTSNVMKIAKIIHSRLDYLSTTDKRKTPSIPDMEIDPLKGTNKSKFVPRLKR